MDIEITDAEIEKIILKREKKKEYQRVYDANKYQQIKEKRLADNKKYYQEEIIKDSKNIKLLKNPNQVEKYAREKYFMKKDSEDIYIIEYERDSVKK